MFALSQLIHFLLWALAGAVFFGVCEALYLVKYANSFRFSVTAVCDAVFCALLVLTVIVTARFLSYGAIYYYSVLGFLAGALAERLTIRKYFVVPLIAKISGLYYNILKRFRNTMQKIRIKKEKEIEK
ncbi:MAG: hypothetical protein FWE62_01115 [Firmicutes bacterium]|nr:hypothetical protein [Bacillota bacterium]